MPANKTTKTEKSTGISRVEKFHPLKTFLFFGLLGSTVVFLTITFLYLTTINKQPAIANFVLPKAFTISTLLLLFSSYTISRSLKAFNNDSFDNLLKSVITTLCLALIFCVSQFFGWKNLFDAGFLLSSQVGISYLYVLTGLHFLHVVVGIGFLIYLTYKAYSKSQDMVDSLMYFSDKNQQAKLELVCIFWHFVDFLWLCMFLMFLFTF